MSTLHLTIGLPGAGKTTYARRWVAENPATRSRCNRDDLGKLMHGKRFYGDETLYGPTEDAITEAQHAMVLELLSSGRDVIVDDTNLDVERRQRLVDAAVAIGAKVEIVDMCSVPLETVLERNARRDSSTGFVPEQVIRDMWERYVAEKAEVAP
ncbi:hypothetical protein Ade02nite_21030 [Paractinoplanes deccanensis]|uniref:Kinase n=1 Tax=Paractinoplanes deccanensis TaxID=113561 RepID=A0ABQ3Y0H2_9ACTN|nr:AAA family ATPase [Actinoplanes deccanensis]GID73462.1 hypothetical protein Ade02nite_21030 [Actinoplanes deccanensis]